MKGEKDRLWLPNRSAGGRTIDIGAEMRRCINLRTSGATDDLHEIGQCQNRLPDQLQRDLIKERPEADCPLTLRVIRGCHHIAWPSAWSSGSFMDLA